MPSRSHYWTCGKFADWIRGTMKPKAATGKGWRTWEKEAKANHPIRYWIAEEGLDYLQNFVNWPTDKLYALKYYINNRWVTHTHSLTAHSRDIKPGEWCDVGNRFLPCLFNELVDFVEIELAWWHIAWADKEEKAKYKAPFWATGWFRWRTWRCPQAGLDNLDWQRGLRWKEEEVGKDFEGLGELTPQAKNAQEILELYNWWKFARPTRPEPMEASGWTAFCERRREQSGSVFDWEDESDQDKKDSKKMLDKMHRMEAQYEKEDEQMMIRLIKIRNALWT